MKTKIIAAALLGGSILSANALTIDVTSPNFNTAWPSAPIGTNPIGNNRWESDLNLVVPPALGTSAANWDDKDVKFATGFTGTITELYKATPGNPDGLSLSESYNTVFTNVGSDPGNFTLSYVAGKPYVSGSPIFLYVKDGANTPYHYLFDISTWNGQDPITGLNFWVGNGAISHVSIFGTSTFTPIPTPDGGTTAVLMGLGLIGLGVVSRRK